MKLDITKIYIDSSFRTKNSKSETDFSIELPRSCNVPDGVVAHIDDIVIPVSWSTIDERNRNCYVRMYYGSSVIADNYAFSVQNYTGAQFATELALILNHTALTLSSLLDFDCVYDLTENLLGITLSDTRNEALKASTPFKLEILTDETLSTGSNRIADPRTINTIIRSTTQIFITEAAPYTCYLDFFKREICI